MFRVTKSRPLRLIFIANFISMIGSGMNGAAVTWYILQATHSEMALGTLVVLQTIPAMLTLPFSSYIIDREDRRRLVMALDAARGVLIFCVALLALAHRAQVWQLYLMSTLVSAAFWMFWPTVTALIQELTPEAEFVQSSSFLLAGMQGGWLIAGALVGFVYDHIGLGGVLLLDVSSYVVSFSCYLLVRRGRHVVERPAHHLADDLHLAENAIARFWSEISDAVHHLRGNRYVILLGTSWALFTTAMFCQGVLTAPLSDRLLHAGAVGYGWMNAAWATGAFTSTIYSPALIRRFGSRAAIGITMMLLAGCLFSLPVSVFIAVAAAIYCLMGSARGVGGVAITSSIMEAVPKYLMGRVQNTFSFASMLLQIVFGFAVGAAAHRIALTAGFVIVGSLYLMAGMSGFWRARTLAPAPAAQQTLAD
jgi:MFS family permease